MLAALLELHAEEDLAGFHGDAVVTNVDVHADDPGVLAAFRVDAVGVGRVVGVVDVEIEQVEMLDEDGVDGPRVAVLDRDAVEGDIAAVHHGDGTGPPCDPLDLRVDPPVAVLRVAVQRALAGDDDVLHLRDVQQTGKAAEGVALPAGEIILVHLVFAGQNAGQDGVVGAVVVAQQDGSLFEVEGGVALQEEACGAVAASRNIDRAAGRTGGQSRLQLAGVVGLAVSHKAIAGGIHKEGLGRRGEGEVQRFALGLDPYGVGGGGQQGEEGEHIGIAALIDGFAVQRDGERMRRVEAQAVLQLKDGTAGHGTDECEVHNKQSAS